MRSKKLKVKKIGNKAKTINGITLITLVITIILLLLLAGIVINVTIGENSIIRNSSDKRKNRDRDIKCRIKRIRIRKWSNNRISITGIVR